MAGSITSRVFGKEARAYLYGSRDVKSKHSSFETRSFGYTLWVVLIFQKSGDRNPTLYSKLFTISGFVRQSCLHRWWMDAIRLNYQENVHQTALYWHTPISLWTISLGSIHTTPEKFENAALFLRLGLPSKLNPSRKLSFSKTLFKSEESEKAGFSLSCERKTKRKRRFRKQYGHDNHVISLNEFSPNTNPKWPVIVAF